jgi:hypothetical protein
VKGGGKGEVTLLTRLWVRVGASVRVGGLGVRVRVGMRVTITQEKRRHIHHKPVTSQPQAILQDKRQDKKRQDKTRQNKTHQDKTRQDKTKQDKTRLESHMGWQSKRHAGTSFVIVGKGCMCCCGWGARAESIGSDLDSCMVA